MRKKKQGLLRSQAVGIAWIIAVLLAMTGWYFFSLRKATNNDMYANTKVAGVEILEKKEDSVYHSRRENRISYRKPERYIPQKGVTEEMYTRETPPQRKQDLRVELNSADTMTLQLLHGIGPAYARRIVKYRERLGGFVADSQLLEVYGFTPELLEHIRPYLEVNTSGRRRIAINRAGLKELARHPYVEYYQARDIVKLRSQGVVFKSETDLRAVPSMADSTLRRVLPYVDFAGPEGE